MKKKFYIVPTTGTYYDICESETREEALCDFTDKMADDMSAYFAATDKEPVQYPHGYKKPKNRFERTMSVIVASVAMDTQSPFYRDNVIEHMDMSNMGVVACLQKAYDMAKASPGQMTVKCRKWFYKILRNITGFELEDRNRSSAGAGPSKIYVSRDRQSAAYKCLDHDHIQYDLDAQGNIIVDGAYLNLALMHIRSMGITAEPAETASAEKAKGMRLVISNIDWETDGEDVELPSQVIIDDPMLLPHLIEGMNEGAENISDWLSEKYEWLVNNFTAELEGVEDV